MFNGLPLNKFSFTCFLGHFKEPLVSSKSSLLIENFTSHRKNDKSKNDSDVEPTLEQNMWKISVLKWFCNILLWLALISELWFGWPRRKFQNQFKSQAFDYILVPGFTNTLFCVFLTLEWDVWALWSFWSLLPASGKTPNDFLIESKTISRFNISALWFWDSRDSIFRLRVTVDPVREPCLIEDCAEPECDSILEFVHWLFVVGLFPKRPELWFDIWFLNDWKFWASTIWILMLLI